MSLMTAGAIEGKRDTPHGRVVLGISSCLLGERVRYDGGHKRDVYIIETLGRVFDFLPCCPETAIGMGVPRPPIRLVVTGRGTRARGVDEPERDVTDALAGYGRDMVAGLRGVSGYIFKSGSPSCGVAHVPRVTESGGHADDGTGVFAGTVMEHLPELPVEEEGRLAEPVLLENFVERVFVYHRWQRLSVAGLTAAGLVDFHARHKFILLAHDEITCRELGRVVAAAGRDDLAVTAQRYIRTMMGALRRPATARSHANVLAHIAGFFSSRLGRDDRAGLLGVIDEYRRGRIPLAVPVGQIRRRLRDHPDDYIARQYYLDPYPRVLMLRHMI